MPIYEYLCNDCGQVVELLVSGGDNGVECTSCNGTNLQKRLSAPAAYSGQTSSNLPGPGDTTCCGSSPGNAGCAGPGSCCGKH